MTSDDFRAAILANTHNEEVLDRLAYLQLPECHLTAGCLFQTIWNARSGYAPD